ncbi:MAG: hypothetical protein OXT49_11305 [Gammaproteobacteria bacterium]|nr:hypothetical protein [Gammaproteobacteria bacterium]
MIESDNPLAAVKMLKHYVLNSDGSLREFSDEESTMIASGLQAVPEFSNERVRYVQVQVMEPKTVEDERPEKQIEVRLAGAALSFNEEGKLTLAEALEEAEAVSEFERQTCAELALQSSDLMTSSIQ